MFKSFRTTAYSRRVSSCYVMVFSLWDECNQLSTDFLQFQSTFKLQAALGVRIIRCLFCREPACRIEMPHVMCLSLVLHYPWRNVLRVRDRCLIKMKNNAIHTTSSVSLREIQLTVLLVLENYILNNTVQCCPENYPLSLRKVRHDPTSPFFQNNMHTNDVPVETIPMH